MQGEGVVNGWFGDVLQMLMCHFRTKEKVFELKAERICGQTQGCVPVGVQKFQPVTLT